MSEFIAWSPYILGFMAVLGCGAWFFDAGLPRFPRLMKLLDKLWGIWE